MTDRHPISWGSLARVALKASVALALLFRLPIVCEAIGALLLIHVAIEALRPERPRAVPP
jgi:hypothetical protein